MAPLSSETSSSSSSSATGLTTANGVPEKTLIFPVMSADRDEDEEDDEDEDVAGRRDVEDVVWMKYLSVFMMLRDVDVGREKMLSFILWRDTTC